ncbi:MAG: hypothetical protein EOM10_16380, partial [Opitutae bacterium]|nr:hypothetical protein [Opitutae bacterium]
MPRCHRHRRSAPLPEGWCGMGDFCMPSLGADMEFGILVEWLVKPGTWVRRGDIVATIETQKGLFEIEAFEDGYLGEPLVQPGEEVPVGTVLAVISANPPSGKLEAKPPTAKPDATRPLSPPHPPPESDLAAAPAMTRPERGNISPAARRLAAELGVD